MRSINVRALPGKSWYKICFTAASVMEFFDATAGIVIFSQLVSP